MILTRETDYALRIIRAVSDGSQKSVVHIAEEHLIPQQFAYKIVRKLHRAGILSVTRGRREDVACRWICMTFLYMS